MEPLIKHYCLDKHHSDLGAGNPVILSLRIL